MEADLSRVFPEDRQLSCPLKPEPGLRCRYGPMSVILGPPKDGGVAGGMQEKDVLIEGWKGRVGLGQ